MGESTSEPASRDDAGLVSAIASGDAAAYAQLHERHVAAARSLADLVAEPRQAEEVLSEAFARLQAELRDGGGPRSAVRLYLLTEVRRAAGQGTDDPELAGSLLARAFAALPERERAALWHAVVEQADPAQTAAILGVPAGALEDLAADASAAYTRSYLKLYEAGLGPEDCREAVGGLDHDVAGAPSSLDAFATLPHLRACRECRAAAIELADLGRSLPGWVAPVYLGVAATPTYLASVRVKVGKKAAPSGRAAGRRRRTGETPRRSARTPRPASHTPPPAEATAPLPPPAAPLPPPAEAAAPPLLPAEDIAPPLLPAEDIAAPAAPPSRPEEHAAAPAAPPPRPAEHAAPPPRPAGRARGRLRNASRQQRVLAAGGLAVAAFAATGLALTLASSNGPAPPPAQHPAQAAIAPPSPAAPAPTSAPSSGPAHRRAHPAKPSPSSSPSPAPKPSATASPTPSPVATAPIQDPFPRHHHHHPPA